MNQHWKKMVHKDLKEHILDHLSIDHEFLNFLLCNCITVCMHKCLDQLPDPCQITITIQISYWIFIHSVHIFSQCSQDTTFRIYQLGFGNRCYVANIFSTITIIYYLYQILHIWNTKIAQNSNSFFLQFHHILIPSCLLYSLL